MAGYPFANALNPFNTGLLNISSFAYPAGAQLAPQGFFGDLVARIGPLSGNLAGGLGQPMVGISLPTEAAGLQQAAAPQVAQQTANVEAQAINGFLQDAASNAIRKLYEYVNANSQRFNQLSGVAPLIGQAVESYRNRDYASAFSKSYQTYRYIHLLRVSVPELPALSPQPQANT